MDFHYEIKDDKLRKMVEKKADELGMTSDRLIWGYINRGLLSDNCGEDVFRRLHSEEYLKQVNEALGLD